MFVPLPAIALGVLGVLVWAVVLDRGPTCPYGDAEQRRRLWMFAGAVCFALAVIVTLLWAWP